MVSRLKRNNLVPLYFKFNNVEIYPFLIAGYNCDFELGTRNQYAVTTITIVSVNIRLISYKTSAVGLYFKFDWEKWR